MNRHYQQQGFTLVELITVIVILGILATSITSFLRFGTQSYTDAADREAIISTARFVVERLNREARRALPNSPRVIAGGLCLEFVPIVDSAIYIDIPVAPEPARNTITLVPFASENVVNSSRISVFALNSNDIYTTEDNGVIANFDANTDNSLAPLYSAADLTDPSVDTSAAVVLTLNNDIQFNLESSSRRLYFISTPISYCVVNEQVLRFQEYNGYIENTGIPNTTGVLMAEYVDNFSFRTVHATLQRNALIEIRLSFRRNLETIKFNHEIQVPNVP